MVRKLALALCLISSTALAQGQLPNHSVPFSAGPGTSGWKSVGPCAGGVLEWLNNTSDPVCGTFGTPLSGGPDNAVQFKLPAGGGFGGDSGFIYGGAPNAIIVQATNSITNDLNERYPFAINVNYDQAISLNPTFSTAEGMRLNLAATHGNYVFGGGTNAKTSFVPLQIFADYRAAGQRFIHGNTINCWGIGDCAIWGNNAVTYAGYPISSDEGSGWQLVSLWTQPTAVNTVTVQTATRNTCNTTATQNITGSAAIQTVTVASGTGCTAGTWVVINHEPATGIPNHEAVQIVSSTSNSINGIFAGTYSSGVTITPALRLTVTGGVYPGGEGRFWVNLSSTPYNTGTVASIAGSILTGSGTTWTNTMLTGGTALSPGCVAQTADDYSSTPFGAGPATLKDWYPIRFVNDTTHIDMFIFTPVGFGQYGGKGPGSGAYTIRPCAEQLRVISNNEHILDDNGFTWTPGDTVEISITPFPAMTGYQWHMQAYSAGGTYTAFADIINIGARKWQNGILIRNNSGPIAAGLPGADNAAWGTALYIESADIGIDVSRRINNIGIKLGCGPPQCSGVSDVGGSITWGIASITPNNNNRGLDIMMATSGGAPDGILQGTTLAPYTTNYLGLQWGGAFRLVPKGANVLPACGAGIQGAIVATNSNTQTWGADASTLGPFGVLAHCNGTNWTVVGK